MACAWVGLASEKSCLEGPQAAGAGYQTSIYRLAGHIAGTLVRPSNESCKVLKVFFPGQAQELGIYNSRVPEPRRPEWGRVLLEGAAYRLGPTLSNAGCPVLLLGESRLSVPPGDLLGLMAETGATEIEFLSHSAGYLGLTRQLQLLKGSPLLAQVRGIKLLDNYYDVTTLPAAIRAAFGESRSSAICSGFYTPHNSARFKSAYLGVCPAAALLGDHKTPVKDYFK